MKIRLPYLGPLSERFVACRHGLELYWDDGKIGSYYSILGLYWDNGKENGNYYLGLFKPEDFYVCPMHWLLKDSVSLRCTI